jgi:hypothetical protein
MRKVLGTIGLWLFTAAAGCGSTQSAPESPEGSEKGEAVQPDESNVLVADEDRAEPSDREEEWGILDRDAEYSRVVARVVGMVEDTRISQGARRRGLDVVNVTWEDTGRAQGSSLGPNITDLTLQVRYRDRGEREQSALMPVIRFPNFSDRSGDIPAGKFFVRVGNHQSRRLQTVPLTEILRDIRRFASDPGSIEGKGNLLAARDTHFLVSAQAVFLPIPKRGKAEFNPTVFNYQSAPGSPAVLTLLVTRQGTSMTVVENVPEDSRLNGWGQELYYNNGGERAAYTAERKSDVERRIKAKGGPKTEDDRSALRRGADVLFLVQVPLKHRNRGALGGLAEESPSDTPVMKAPSSAAAPMQAERKSDVEQAVLGHGRNRGPFSEGRGLLLERDPRFPIRITVQFYKATSNGVVDEADLDAIAASIGSVYEHAEFVGSLVVPEGDPRRPSEWQKIPNQWFPW